MFELFIFLLPESEAFILNFKLNNVLLGQNVPHPSNLFIRVTAIYKLEWTPCLL